MKRIDYAFGRDYLSDWTIEDALREVFQNYIDYGDYDIKTKQVNNDTVYVTISNHYNPRNLEFLRLGNTSKDDGKSIGHHGEGLKAAFLIFAREDLFFDVVTSRNRLIGAFDTNPDIGEVFHISYTDVQSNVSGFVTSFHCPGEIYHNFIKNIITEKDILFKDPNYGELLAPHKGSGNIYSGNLFVCHVDDLDYSYNIYPEHLTLDRDRKVPREFDVDYATSKILQSYRHSKQNDVIETVNYNSREYRFTDSITDKEVETIKAVKVENSTQFYDTKSKDIITNERVKNILTKHPKFVKTIKRGDKDKVKELLIKNKRKKVITLLKEFKSKHPLGDNALIDLEVITQKIKQDNDKSRSSRSFN